MYAYEGCHLRLIANVMARGTGEAGPRPSPMIRLPSPLNDDGKSTFHSLAPGQTLSLPFEQNRAVQKISLERDFNPAGGFRQNAAMRFWISKTPGGPPLRPELQSKAEAGAGVMQLGPSSNPLELARTYYFNVTNIDRHGGDFSLAGSASDS